MRYLDIVFEGEIPNARFIETERNGKSCKVGEWIERDDGLWALRIVDRWAVYREFPDWIDTARVLHMTPEQVDFEMDAFIRQLWKDGKL
jgi:hypothetical protein